MKISSLSHGPPRQPQIVAKPASSDTFSPGLEEPVLLKPEVYYDGVQDLKDRQAYYDGLEVNFDSLSRHLIDTHTHHLEYHPKHHLYTWVDLRPSMRLRSIYSARPVQAGDPLRGRHDPDAPRLAALLASAPTDAVELAARIAISDCKNFFNCEHTVPKVWSGKDPVAEGDLHHLFVAERSVNEGRGASKLTESDPKAGRGELARATLYYLLRYPGHIGDHPGEYTAEDVQILVQWHRENPVTLHERHRNQSIFALQGNRNPLIDHPEWADRIDFRRGLASPAP